MNHTIVRACLIIVIAAAVAAVANLVSPNRIEWTGYWPNVFDSDSVWLSPSYEEGDPPAIHLGLAYDRFLSKRYLFVDAREPEEYEVGHIEGAINLPFDSFDDYWPQVQPLMPVAKSLVIYCSGSECESSLNLARLLVEEFNYAEVEIFFGGWRAWYNNRLPLEGEHGYENSHE